MSTKKSDSSVQFTLETWSFILETYWFCPTCGKSVPDEHVTYEETHDIRCGGCGDKVELNIMKKEKKL